MNSLSFLMILWYGILIITAVAILMYGILIPHRNWDMVVHVAAAYHKDGYRGADLNGILEHGPTIFPCTWLYSRRINIVSLLFPLP